MAGISSEETVITIWLARASPRILRAAPIARAGSIRQAGQISRLRTPVGELISDWKCATPECERRSQERASPLPTSAAGTRTVSCTQSAGAGPVGHAERVLRSGSERREWLRHRQLYRRRLQPHPPPRRSRRYQRRPPNMPPKSSTTRTMMSRLVMAISFACRASVPLMQRAAAGVCSGCGPLSCAPASLSGPPGPGHAGRPAMEP